MPSGITAEDSYEAPKISPCSLRNSGRGSTASAWRAVRPIDSELARLASVMATAERLPLRVVCLEERRIRLAVQDRGELPREILHVLDAAY